ncbi:PREDICTED: uncharacterized protein LOC104608074 [Nelumbo nucifera]|uniref:Uncharacterized protein LOC104608074 n=2 Tax=Nelumbo nucifera TaxID=4432 RepID=A0A1U8B7K4_NELNU|nr:PREDICTED: uncharacterized protein LOC104608074 [Nelumbo nucifera]XP_010272239.1 PREDICTED: uncharacterized protein LOC104608074 [Nelumbo nucifera]XP_010272240.1 PREDICTED: uncharacterized protein LOC104608074 [Nelumbo nucifera]DAD43754.1 TPA_asm: hypothetical protein HUJ06_001984 [Nelumbo nucifera]
MSSLDRDKALGNNRREDVSWLFSLSGSELDMLVSLKKLVIQRAKVIGHDALASKFDLKMLRVIGFILMEYLKGQFQKSSVVSAMNDSSTFLDDCNLSRDLKGSPSCMSREEIVGLVNAISRKRTKERSHKEEACSQKRKKTKSS